MRPDELERRLLASLDALGLAPATRQEPRGGYSSKLATCQDRDPSRTSVASPTHSLNGWPTRYRTRPSAPEPRGAHTPIDVAVRRELPGAPPHVPDPEAVGNEALQGLLDRVLRLRRGSTPGAEHQEAYDRPREGSRDHQREQCSRLHAGKDARLLPRVPLIAELEAAGVA